MYEGKTILVTGSASRTGFALAEYLLGRGAFVYCNYRKNDADLESLLDGSGNGTTIRGDVTRPADVERMADQVREQSGRLDGLLNVVGDYIEKSVMETSYEEWQWMFRSNLDSAFLMSKAFYPLLKKAEYGRAINFSFSNSDRVVASYRTPYQIANTGILVLTRTLAKEWGKDEITVNSISIGTLRNSITKESENPRDFIPCGRFGEHKDLFPILDMVFRRDSEYLTGSNFLLSGGYNI